MSWFSLHWFTYPTLKSFQWANIHLFWLIALIPLFIFLKWVFKSSKRPVLVLTIGDTRSNFNILAKLRFLVPLLFLAGVLCVILALARPQLPNVSSESLTEGVDIAIAVDVSVSMLETDLQPNRLEAAKKIAGEFVKGRVNDRIALVAFAGETITLSPLTTDYSALENYLDMLNTSLISTSGTAIGVALASCINKLRDVQGKSKVAIIISDGDNMGGNINPETALTLANSFGVRVYTIAIGKSTSKETIDEKTLKMLAEGGGGEFFRATDNSVLSGIFSEIDRLEKNLYQRQGVHDMTDYYYPYLYWALTFFILSLFLRFTYLGNLLED